MSDSGDDGSNSQIVWSGGLGGQHHSQSGGNASGGGGRDRDRGDRDGAAAAGGGGVAGQQQLEQELATKMLQIQSKRFYLDVKQNRRGRFIKVAEIGADGRRNQIFLALSTAGEFRDHLSAFSDYYSSLGPPNPDTVPEDGKLKSEMMLKDNRRYYLDLKENSRGRFLRVSQTVPRGGTRTQVAIPAQGMIEFRDALTDLLEEFSCSGDDLGGGGGGSGGSNMGGGTGSGGAGGGSGGGYRSDLPEGKHLHVDNKNFYFDIGQNNRGVYMRISEVKTNFRAAITLPDKCWTRFRDILNEYCDKMKGSGGGGGGGSGGGSSASGGNSGGGVGQVGQGPAAANTTQQQLDHQLGNGTVSSSLDNMGGK